MSSLYTMRVLIDEETHPDLYAELSKARHPRARAEMLRRLASQFLKQQGGTQVPPARGNTEQGHVVTSTSEPRQRRTTGKDDPGPIGTSTPAKGDGLRLPANLSTALVAGAGKYLA
jgi:hypothetical protein